MRAKVRGRGGGGGWGAKVLPCLRPPHGLGAEGVGDVVGDPAQEPRWHACCQNGKERPPLGKISPILVPAGTQQQAAERGPSLSGLIIAV